MGQAGNNGWQEDQVGYWVKPMQLNILASYIEPDLTDPVPTQCQPYLY